MNLPNRLTMLRIIMIPVFMLFAMDGRHFIPYAPLWAGIVFAAASFTDFLDGYIARRRNLITDFGKFADPLADKILTTAAFICMMADGACSPVVLAVILAREFAVSGVRMVAAASGDGKVIAANLWGKVKTVLQMAVIILYYLAMGIAATALPADMPLLQSNLFWHISVICQALCWLVALVTVLSGVQYILLNRKYISAAK